MSPALPAGWSDPARLRIAHLSDLHVRVPGRIYLSGFKGTPEENNQQVVTALAEADALAADLVVLTGDLVDTSDPAEYELLAAMLRKVRTPIRLIPGNHDRWSSPGYPDGQFERGCAVLGVDFRPVERLKGWDLVAIDTSRCEKMSTEHRAQVPQLLAGSEPCVVLSHSPLLPVGNLVDAMSFLEPAFVRALPPRVKVVLSGHAHKGTAWEHNGVLHLTAPSVSYGIGGAPGFSLVCLGTELSHSLPPTQRFADSACYDPAAWT